MDYFNLKQDPFEYQKKQGLEKTGEDIAALTGFLAERLIMNNKVENTLRDGVYFSLWGNQADLSPSGQLAVNGIPGTIPRKALREHLLADDIKQVLSIFKNSDQPVPRVDIMLDNAGFELVSDLALVDILLHHRLADQVLLHVKAHPTFVSDVIEADLDQTINFLIASQDGNTSQFGKRIKVPIFQEEQDQGQESFLLEFAPAHYGIFLKISGKILKPPLC